jgi:hypothetical protein
VNHYITLQFVNKMSLICNKYLNNYQSIRRIETIKNFIKYNPTNISFLWDNTYYNNTDDYCDVISGQLILEYCEDHTWRPLTYTTPSSEVYCYILERDYEISELISSYEFADSLIQQKSSEATEEEFNTFICDHFGRTSDQLVYEIIKTIDTNDYKRYNYRSKDFKHFKNKLHPKSYNAYKLSDVVQDIYDKNIKTDDDEEDEYEDKTIPEVSEYDDDYYEEDGKTKKR